MSKQSVYTVHSGDECGGDPCYDVLKGPGDFECWLTEPEDRSFWRDLSPVVERLESLEQSNTQLREQNRVLREALERLAILGNEPLYGNSAGNVIAQKALGLPATVHMTKPAALTATSQPVSEKGDYSHHPAFDEYGEHR